MAGSEELVAAVDSGIDENVIQVVKAGADPNSGGTFRGKVLNYAIAHLGHKVAPHGSGLVNLTAFTLLELGAQPDLGSLVLLLERIGDQFITPEHAYIVAKAIVDQGIDLNHSGIRENIFHTLEEEYLSSAELFLKAGMNINQPHWCYNRGTPLHVHCTFPRYRNPVVIKWLLDNGADKSALDDKGRTPLESLLAEPIPLADHIENHIERALRINRECVKLLDPEFTETPSWKIIGDWGSTLTFKKLQPGVFALGSRIVFCSCNSFDFPKSGVQCKKCKKGSAKLRENYFNSLPEVRL